MLISLLSLLSCQSDFEDEVNQPNTNNVRFEKVSLKNNDLKTNSKLFESVNNVSKLKQSNFGKIVYDSIYDFYYDDENGAMITSGSYDSYTFPIYRNIADTKVENLVFSKNAYGNYDAILVRYDLETYDLENLTKEELSETHVTYTNLDTGKYSAACGASVVMCDNNGSGGNGTNHVAGSNCFNTQNTAHLSVQMISFPCYGSGTSGSGNIVGIPGGIPPILTVPIPPIVITPCQELKKMSESFNVKSTLTNLQNKAQDTKESGFAIKKSATNRALFLPGVVLPQDPRKPNSVKVSAYFNGDYVGLEHNHTNPLINGSVPMFSGPDVAMLYDLANVGATSDQFVSYSEYFVTVAVHDHYTNTNTTFAVKIKDPTALNLYAQNDENMDDLIQTINEEEIRLTVETRNNNPSSTNNLPPTIDKLKKLLLKIFSDKNLGIGLYQADAGINNWSEITYNKDTDTLNPPIPCN